jgi:hypothetical protein
MNVANLNAKNRLVKPFVPNSKIIFTLPLGGKIRKGSVILSGNVNVTAGTTSGVVKGEGGPANLISRVIVTATPAGGSRYPGGKIVDCDVRSLIRYSITQRQGKLIIDQGGSSLSAGAVANSSIYTAIPIYWADSVQKNTLATALNTDPGTYASVQVEVDTANLAACFTGNDRTVDYSGLTVQWLDERVAVPGDTAVLYQESHVALIAATNKRMLDEAMPQDGAFMSWQICAEQSSALTLADTLLNRIVAAGPTLDFDKYAQDIRQTMLDDEWLDPSQTSAGYFFIDFTDGAVQANTVPGGTIQTYFDVNNVSGANADDLNISTRRVFQPSPAGK